MPSLIFPANRSCTPSLHVTKRRYTSFGCTLVTPPRQQRENPDLLPCNSVRSGLLPHLSDKIGRRNLYIAAAAFFAIVVYPVLLMYQTKVPFLIWLGMVIGFVIPGVAMQATFQTMLTEMFDAEARTTGVGLGYQLSNTFGGGFAPMICVALVAAAGGAVWPVAVYVAVIAVVGILATIFASMRPDTGSSAEQTLAVEAKEVVPVQA